MAQQGRRQRRAAQSKAARSRRSVRPGPRSERDRRRRRITWVAAISLTVVLAAAAAAPLLVSSSSKTTTAPVHLVSRTLLDLPAASAVAEGDGAGFVTDDRRDLLVKFSPSDGRVEGSVHLAGRPVDLVLDGGHLWVADMVDNQVVEVEAGTLAVVRSVPVATAPSGLAVLDGAVWVTSVSGNTLTPVDAASGVAGTPIAVPSGAVRIAAGFGALWVTGSTDRLTRIVPSPTGGGTPRQSTVTVGRGPIGVATGAGAVWVANAPGESVSKVDPTSLDVVQLERIGSDPLSIAVADRRVYVGFGSGRALRMVSPSPGSEVLDVGTDPGALLAVGADVWVAGADPGRVFSVSAPGAPPVSTG